MEGGGFSPQGRSSQNYPWAGWARVPCAMIASELQVKSTSNAKVDSQARAPSIYVRRFVDCPGLSSLSLMLDDRAVVGWVTELAVRSKARFGNSPTRITYTTYTVPSDGGGGACVVRAVG